MKASLEELYLRSLAELALIKQIVSIHANAVELWGLPTCHASDLILDQPMCTSRQTYESLNVLLLACLQDARHLLVVKSGNLWSTR
jgi:hypothetical protein